MNPSLVPSFVIWICDPCNRPIVFLPTMYSIFRRPSLPPLICIMVLIASDHFLGAEQPLFNRPVAIAVSADGALAFIGNHNEPFITVADTNSFETKHLNAGCNGLMDLVVNPASNRLLAIAKYPPQIIEFSAKETNEAGRLGLPGIPAKLAISLDCSFVCITMTWKHTACLIQLVDKNLPEEFQCKMISLEFQPKEVLPLAKELFLVADAFGDQLAVIDANSAKVIATHKILGHHIGGLARDDSMQSIAITHQKLSAVAQTNQDDIHWGTLMQNLVSVVPESDLIDSTALLSKTALRFPLGDVGNGAADPSGVVAWDGRLAIAIAGSNQIAFRDNPRGRFQYVKLDQSPTRIVRAGSSRLVSVSTLGDKATILETSGGLLQMLEEIGQTKTIDSAEARGEAAFFAGSYSHDNWMSCSSCHVDGHTPDLLADTKGDGRFGNPKRIPSLLNVSETGPWTWGGSESNLEGQIKNTLVSTMHRDELSRGNENDLVAKDIAAFLQKQKLPQEGISVSDRLLHGRSLFELRGCIRCHIPEQHYTSREIFDVGVVDELGQSQFNPPSLEGISHRKAFFHDARYKSLAELLKYHPDSRLIWTTDEVSDLVLFLMSL